MQGFDTQDVDKDGVDKQGVDKDSVDKDGVDRGLASRGAEITAAGGDGARLATGRRIARTVLAIAYLGAGVLHLVVPGPFVAITPDWVPFPHQVIALTGLCEIAGAIGLMNAGWRRAAGIGLALYAVCVFPANIKHAFEPMPDSIQLGWWYHAPRLVLQPVLVWWALFAGGTATWPFSTPGGLDRRRRKL